MIYISLEGIDGNGKTTLVRNYERWILSNKSLNNDLRGDPAVVWIFQEPSTGIIGRTLKNVLNTGETLSRESWHWLFQADRWEVNKVIQGLAGISSAARALSDRCIMSSMVYQSERGESEEQWKESMEEILNFNHKLLLPDYVVLIDISPETSYKRILARGNALEVFEKKESLEIFRRGYFLTKEVLESHGVSVPVISGEGTIEESLNILKNYNFPVWVPCPDCEDFYCVQHKKHAAICNCPEIEEFTEKGLWPYASPESK